MNCFIVRLLLSNRHKRQFELMIKYFCLFLLIAQFVTCANEDREGWLGEVVLDNTNHKMYQPAIEGLRIKKVIFIDNLSGFIDGEVISAFEDDLSVIIVSRNAGVTSVSFDGDVNWHLSNSDLGVSLLSPLLYAFHSGTNREFCVFAGGSDQIRCFSSAGGDFTRYISNPFLHDNALELDMGTVVFETENLYPSKVQNEYSNLVTIQHDSAVSQYGKHLNIIATDRHYAYNNTLSWQNGEVQYTRPYRDTIYVYDQAKGVLRPILKYKFLKSHVPSEIFRNTNIENAYEEIVDRNLVELVWVRYVNEKLIASYNWGGVNSILVSAGDSTMINTSIIDFKEIAIAAPTIPGNDGAMYYIDSYSKYRVLQLLKSMDYKPNKDWDRIVKDLDPIISGVPEAMVLVVVEVL